MVTGELHNFPTQIFLFHPRANKMKEERRKNNYGRWLIHTRSMHCPPTAHTTFVSQVQGLLPIQRAGFAHNVDTCALPAPYRLAHHMPASSDDRRAPSNYPDSECAGRDQ